MMIMIILASFALANETENTITEHQQENLYVLATQKNIKTTINGDLFLITAESNIEGTINKDLNAISSKINIQGVIGDDLRIIAAEAIINAYVFNELRIIASELTIKNATIIKGKTTIITENAKIEGTYENIEIDSKNLELNAIIKGNAKINTNQIKIHPDTKIEGNLEINEGIKINKEIVKG